MGDSSDNIPGVPGIGEKTAMKLIGQYGTVENLLAHTAELKGRQKEMLEQHADLARVSKRLATILCGAPCPVDLDSLKLLKANDDALKALFMEFEFNSIGRRLFGEDFKAGRGGSAPPAKTTTIGTGPATSEEETSLETDLEATGAPESGPIRSNLKVITDTQHEYRIAASSTERAELI